MARKTVVAKTKAELAAEEYRREVRLDSAERRAKLSTTEILRRKRGDKLTDEERLKILLNRCRSAAALEVRGEMFSPEDRADIAADLMARVLEDFSPNVPMADDERVSLSVLTGRAANLRRSLQAIRERDQHEFLQHAAERAASPESAALAATIEAAQIAAAERPEAAKRDAERIAARLELDPAGPSLAPLYQWLRDAAGPVCADELGYTAGSWRKRVTQGGRLIRAAFTDAADVLRRVIPESGDVLDCRQTRGEILYSWRDESREAAGRYGTYAGAILRERAASWRAGTAAGSKPVRPDTADTARALCKVRRVKPQTLAAERRRERVRRDHVVSVTGGRKTRRVAVAGRSDAQSRADALRAIGRETVRQSRRRERAVSAKTDLPSRDKRAA